MSSDEDRATTTGNMYEKFCEVWTCCFRDMRSVRFRYAHYTHQ